MGALMYLRDPAGRLLLIRRSRRPNQGLWCAVGGKLRTPTGESPYECASRELYEEVGLEVDSSSLDLRCILSEKNYENTGHWLMFVFFVSVTIDSLPSSIDEGDFQFFELEELEELEMPELDKRILREYVLPRDAVPFASLRVDGGTANYPQELLIEESFLRDRNE